ncbi:MAG: hypothetical protein QOH95_1820, partial [Gaiellaceae bacterium]|nr:hypothetical protein [Gaiellaceae bacterium]
PPIDRSLLGDRYLALPLDFDSMLDSSVVEASDLFLVDDEEQYADQRGMGRFATWPARPHGRVTLDSQSADRVVCANLGIGALDAAYAHVVYRRALTAGAGITLPR